ncbi:GAF domain-containing protein [Halorubraceae archaeon YAN]|nr:GAF domain-containing protein [Halorubraceae archaeon YAN]
MAPSDPADSALNQLVCNHIFNDSSLRWILHADGTVDATNERAAAAVTTDSHDTVFWEGEWWAGGDRQQLQSAVQTAATGMEATYETSAWVADSQRSTVELTIEPLSDSKLLATAIDISERAQLAEELQRSEELHRVTLNNMTDTVLVTNDAGEFTYICPNVHFIFGYTVEEIAAIETVDQLLGEELFDPDTLDQEGVLTNIETTSVDKEGNEHTLLVNIKRVDIQDGTTLYSCRDITTRKQREVAVSVLHDTAQQLMYAETAAEIATKSVDGANETPGFSGVAVYQYDDAINTLVPIAVTEPHMTFASVTAVPVGDNILSHAFLDSSLRVDSLFHSGHDQICVPIGDHGVIVFDPSDQNPGEVTIEIAELFAATVEAAFDRVSRDARVRERDQWLQTKNTQLQRVNEINRLIRTVDQDIIAAETRQEIEQAVCERLVSEWFAFAWIGETADNSQPITPRVWAGGDSGLLDAIEREYDADEPALSAYRSGDTVWVSNIAEDPKKAAWRKHALRYGYQSVVSVPLSFEGVIYGVLTVFSASPDTVESEIRAVLTELGETVGAAISAVARKEALYDDRVTVRTYQSGTPTGVFGRLATATEATVSLTGISHQQAETDIYVELDGCSADTALSEAISLTDIVDGSIVSETSTGGVLQLQTTSTVLPVVLASHGVRVREFVTTPDSTHITVAIVPPTSVQAVNTIIKNQIPNVQLQSQTEQLTSISDPQETFKSELTTKQYEAIQTAYHAGYFAIPREATGQEVATVLGISPQAFHQHIRAAHKKLYQLMLEATAI